MKFCFFKIIYFSFILALSGCHSKPAIPQRPDPAVTGFVVKPQTIPATFEFVGMAKSSHPVQIRARVEGYLWGIDYEEGSYVQQGQLLFHLDPRNYEASVRESEGELAKEEAILWRAKRSLERIRPLFEKNAVSQKDLDDATANVLASEANIIAAKARLFQDELNLSYTKITSPIDGVSGRAVYKEGSLIMPSANGLLTQVSVIDPIWVLFSISDNEILQGQGEKEKNELVVPKRQEYTVRLQLADGNMYPEEGRVNFSSPTLDPDTGSLVVRAEFKNPKKKILPGQFVKAFVSGAIRPNAIFVPQKSVFQGINGMSVFVVGKNGKASLRDVEVGDWYEDYWIIKKGLIPGEVVVVEGTNKVADGVTVNVMSTSSVPEPKVPQEDHL